MQGELFLHYSKIAQTQENTVETQAISLTDPKKTSKVSFLKTNRSHVHHSLFSVKTSDDKTLVLVMQLSLEEIMIDCMCLYACVSFHSSYQTVESPGCQLTAVSPHSFTAAVDRGRTMMARMCGEQLRIIQATSPVHVCMNFYRHSSIKPVFFQSSANERFAPLEHHTGRSDRKTQQLPSFVPLASKDGPLNTSQ